MQVICTDGTTVLCEGYELNQYGVALYGQDVSEEGERYDSEPEQIGYVPHGRLWYILPDSVEPNVPGATAERDRHEQRPSGTGQGPPSPGQQPQGSNRGPPGAGQPNRADQQPPQQQQSPPKHSQLQQSPPQQQSPQQQSPQQQQSPPQQQLPQQPQPTQRLSDPPVQSQWGPDSPRNPPERWSKQR